MAELPGTTADEYRTLLAALDHVRCMVADASAARDLEGPGSDVEADRLGDVVQAALTLAVIAGELEWGGDSVRRLQSRIALASRAATLARSAIHTPMDPPLAFVFSAEALLGMAMEVW